MRHFQNIRCWSFGPSKKFYGKVVLTMKKKSRSRNGSSDNSSDVNLAKALRTNKRSGIKKGVIRDLHQDMNNWTGGAGFHETSLNPQMADGQKYVLLETASGHVGETLGGNNPDQTYRELLRCATVALSWAQVIRKGKVKKWAATK